MKETIEKNLQLLAECFAGNNPELLRSIMADDMQYYSEASKTKIDNIDALIERMSHVSTGQKITTTTATVKIIPTTYDFRISPRCILLFYGTDNISSSDKVLVHFADDGKIDRIYISIDKSIVVEMDRPKEFPSDSEIEKQISEFFANYTDESELAERLKKYANVYYGDIYDYAFRAAIRHGVESYIEEHAEDFDLNDGGDHSTYLYETDDEDIQSLLIELGAFRSWDTYDDCKFAVETVNGSILAFDTEFQQEVFTKYLETFKITESDVIAMFEDEEMVDEFESEHDRYFNDDMDALGVTAQDGSIEFSDMVDEDGSDLRDLLALLGWHCEFEGEQWKLETNGVYFIR